MSTFQILMFAMTLFFAYQIFRHVQNLDDSPPNMTETKRSEPVIAEPASVAEADKAYEEGNLAGAKMHLEEALHADPANPEILNKLAFVTAKSGDRLSAIELYERSLELDENDDLTHNAIASLYRAEHAYERAQDHYLKALEIDDTYAQTYYNYGNLLVDMHDIDAAHSMYTHALELQHDFVQAREALQSLGRIKND
ncbi:MAG: tetratricopeptide repeat protein [Sulfuricurvum sp.]|uniref:tetratricopeptide repeat protein n=1 Tax=Sulfuricurvum sp. TaxID=2025608 RepID=UPI00263728DA|nr:tetratricopeptide repeat protein [Sulfuricurvum sp.]MDD2949803.1 tetratricopeptide repeat protein [Sulfuricurvum sp.]MDD5119003.1 tetratricopeptide repeat protein [Sulfuricurvum sp.]